MTSLMIEQLQQLKIQKEQIRQEEISLQKEIEEEERKRLLELDGTIDKLNIQINEIAKCIDGKIMPNNIHIIHHQMQQDLQKETSEYNRLHGDGVLYGDELKKRTEIIRKKNIDIREKNGYNTGRNRNGYLVLHENEKLITLTEFINNLNKVDDKTKETFKNNRRILPNYSKNRQADPRRRNSEKNKEYTFNQLVELNPEQASMNTIVPIFRTIMNIMKKQQEEINQLKSIIASQ